MVCNLPTTTTRLLTIVLCGGTRLPLHHTPRYTHTYHTPHHTTPHTLHTTLINNLKRFLRTCLRALPHARTPAAWFSSPLSVAGVVATIRSFVDGTRGKIGSYDLPGFWRWTCCYFPWRRRFTWAFAVRAHTHRAFINSAWRTVMPPPDFPDFAIAARKNTPPLTPAAPGLLYGL